MSKVLAFKLLSGEEFISETKETSTGWEAINPVVLIPTGTKSFDIVPWFHTSTGHYAEGKNRHFYIELSALVCSPGQVDPALETKYNELFGNIVVAHNKIITD